MSRTGEKPPPSGADNAVISEWRRHWTSVLAGGIGCSVGSINPYILGVFMIPLQQEFGWSRAAIAAGLTISSGAGVIFAPFAGAVIDRVGPRRIAIVGVACYCAATAMFGLVNSSLWSWYSVWLALCVGAVACKPTVWMTPISRMFNSSRGLAIAVTLCGSALASTIGPLLSSYFLQRFGWRAAYGWLAGVWAVAALIPLVLFFDREWRKPPSADAASTLTPAQNLPGLEVKEALKGWPFRVLLAVPVLMMFGVVGFVVHFVPLLISLGIPARQAPFMASLVGVFAVVGRLGSGLLLDRFQGPKISAALMLLPLIPAALLLYDQTPSVAVAMLAACVLGLGSGSELQLVSYLSSRYFGPRRFAILFGTITASVSLGGALGPVGGGYLFDVTHSYAALLWTVGVLCTIAAALTATLGKFPDFSSRTN